MKENIKKVYLKNWGWPMAAPALSEVEGL